MKKEELNGKVALITGGSSGIGKACALLFAQRGASVIIASRSEHGHDVADQINQFSSALLIRTDVGDPKSIAHLFSQISKTYGKIDFAVNSAGARGEKEKLAHEFSENDWNYVININLTGLWLCIKEEIPLMLKNGGAIVNVSSIAGLKIGVVSAVYTASKHAVVGLTKAVALEYAKKNIRVNTVCPAFIDTPMLVGTDIKKQAAQVIPMGRCGTSEEVAQAVLWLCSNEASFITGASLPLDGGLLA